WIAYVISLEVWKNCRILILPDKRLSALDSRLFDRSRIMNRLEQLEAFAAGSRLVGKYSRQPQPKDLVTRVARHQATQLGDRFLTPAIGGHFRLIIRFGPFPVRGLVAEDLVVDLHGFFCFM